MKKIFLVLFSALAILATSCDNEMTIPQEQLPAKSQQFLNQYFADLEISYILADHNSYDVKLSIGYEVEFHKNGNWKEVDCKMDAIPTGFAPQSIYDYVTANFPTNFITKISHNCHGYDVELNNDLDLDFDKNGNFKRIDD